MRLYGYFGKLSLLRFHCDTQLLTYTRLFIVGRWRHRPRYSPDPPRVGHHVRPGSGRKKALLLASANCQGPKNKKRAKFRRYFWGSLFFERITTSVPVALSAVELLVFEPLHSKGGERYAIKAMIAMVSHQPDKQSFGKSSPFYFPVY